MITQKEEMIFQENPVEFVRLQSDNNDLNVKGQLSLLVQKICALKYGTKKDKLPATNLLNFLQTIQGNLGQL
jgi:hypothetical protein